MDSSILQSAGIDVSAGKGYTGNDEKYLSAIQRYLKNYEKNKTNVVNFYNAKDWENYMICVHALKSNSRMIGAITLSEAFEKLEEASRDKEIDMVEALHGQTVSDYDALVEKLSPFAAMEEVHAADEISAEVAKETVDKLLEALDDFDDELSKELAVKLSGYPFRITQRDRLKEAIALIEDFSYDEAAEIIKEITPTIE